MLISTAALSQEQAINLHESKKKRTHQIVIASAQSLKKKKSVFLLFLFLLFFMEVFPEASALIHCSAVAVFLTEALWITGVPFLLRLSVTGRKIESFQMLLHAALFLFFSSIMCFQLCVYVVSLRLF